MKKPPHPEPGLHRGTLNNVGPSGERYPHLAAALHHLLAGRSPLITTPTGLWGLLEAHRRGPWPKNPIALSLWLKNHAHRYGLEAHFSHDGLQRWLTLEQHLKHPYRVECLLDFVAGTVRAQGRAVINGLEFALLEGMVLSEPVGGETAREFAGLEGYRVRTSGWPYLLIVSVAYS